MKEVFWPILEEARWGSDTILAFRYFFRKLLPTFVESIIVSSGPFNDCFSRNTALDKAASDTLANFSRMVV